jgi:DNA replication protein
MSEFQGFPVHTEYVSVPGAFFSRLVPEIEDLLELKVSLQVIAALYRKKGYPRFVGFNEMLGDPALAATLAKAGEKPDAALRRALTMAVDRGTLLSIALLDSGDDIPEDVYFLNDEPGRQTITKFINGELNLSALKAAPAPEAAAEAPSDIFKLYEENIGMLAPLVADELREIEKLYSPEWIRDAIKEAALHNKRNIKYISKILENWSVEGRSDGTHQRDTQKEGPEKYFGGKYGHMVQH